MDLPLSLRRKGDSLVYGIPLWYRIAAAGIAAVVVLAVAGSGGFSIPGAIVAALAVLGALYEERWTFDGKAAELRARLGLVVAARGPRVPFSDIVAVRVDVFAKGRLDQNATLADEKLPPGSQVRIVVDARDGQSYLVDSAPFKRKDRIEEAARCMAEFAGVPLA